MEERNLSKEDYQKIFSLTQGLQKCKLSNPRVDDETIETLLLNNPHLHSLELWACGELTNRTLNNISKRGQKMRNLWLSVKAAFSQKAVCAMLKSLSKLENFDFYGNLSDQDVLAIAAAIPKIKMLTLEEWKVSKVSTIVSVGKLCPHLKLLDLEVRNPKKRLSSPTTIFFKLEKFFGNAINTHREYFKNLQCCYVNFNEVYTNEKLS